MMQCPGFDVISQTKPEYTEGGTCLVFIYIYNMFTIAQPLYMPVIICQHDYLRGCILTSINWHIILTFSEC